MLFEFQIYRSREYCFLQYMKTNHLIHQRNSGLSLLVFIYPCEGSSTDLTQTYMYTLQTYITKHQSLTFKANTHFNVQYLFVCTHQPASLPSSIRRSTRSGASGRATTTPRSAATSCPCPSKTWTKTRPTKRKSTSPAPSLWSYLQM